MKKLILVFTVIFTFQNFVFSQVIPELMIQDDTILYEKLYLHIDREVYSPGDDVWFKAYLVSGIEHKLMPGFKNIYVQLIDEEGNIIDQCLILSAYGVSYNDFHLPDTLPKGQYTIRGYTKYLQNFGEESLFHQKIAVASPTDVIDYEDKAKEQKIMDISFLPESGNLVMNASNYIAFKAINEKGKGIPVSGKIIDETGKVTVSFESKYKGMGTFVMMPQEGKKYYAKIDDHPDFFYQFEDASIDGLALHYQQKGNNLQFILSRNFKSRGTKNLHLVVSHRSEELFREEIEMSGFQYPVEIYKGFFPLGISKITVFDALNNIVAERLVFIRNSDEETLKITSNKTEYQPREKIELKIESLLNLEEDTILTSLSVAVVNENYLSSDGRSQTIESYLLFDSELKDPIESPAAFFTDEENISADEKLELAMMINGWRKYYWDELEDYFRKPLNGWADVGLTIRGEVNTVWGGNTVKDAIITLGPFSSQFLLLKDITDEFGRFSFNRLYLKDSSLIMVNAVNKSGNRSVEIFHKPASVFDTILSKTEINRATKSIVMPQKFYHANYYRYLAERDFKLQEGSILLKDVEVIRKFRTPVNILATYGFVNRSYTISDADLKYQNVIKYLELEVPNVWIDENDKPMIGFAEIPAKIYVDGYGSAYDIETMSLDDIAKIEIINPSWRHFPFEINGGKGGVISILTKTGFGKFNDEFVRKVNGRITPLVRGFRQAREFYSPTYPLEQDSIIIPDQRPTLCWNPSVLLENGEANLEFYTSDMTGRYQIIVEGISSQGKLICETIMFNVDVAGK